jgi:hypothetical protein
LQIFQISGVGKRIKHAQGLIAGMDPGTNKITANKASSTSD